MTRKGSITIKELHAQTGAHVRRAGRGRTPVPVTDRGKVVAALVPPTLLPAGRRRRTVLAEYGAWLSRRMVTDVLRDLDAERGER
jgi:antitoxin (DNA-binding transcriptional repressor) of toxin-antitoxin stability system